MRAVLHGLQILAFVSRSGAFAPVAFSSQCLLSRRSGHGVAPQAVPDPTGNDAAEKALERAKQLRQEVADLEEELAKGKPKIREDQPQPDVVDRERARVLASSPFSLAPSQWLVMLDVGREKGTWMPQNWGISGRRVEVDLLVKFLPGGDMEAKVDSPFVDMTVTPGRWSVGAAEGTNRRRPASSLGSLTSDTCRFWVEASGLTRGDVTIPEGKLYFAVPCWGGKLSRKGLITVRQRRWLDTAVSEDVVLARFKKLQTQSDIRGVSMDGVPEDKVDLSVKEAYCIGVGFGMWLRKEVGDSDGRLRVSVGRDPRLSGEELSKAIIGGMTSPKGGCDVGDCGLCTTPAMFMSCVTEGYLYDGAVMITASHLPSHRNGFKFFTKSGGLSKEDIAEIVALAAAQYGDGSFEMAEPREGTTTKTEFLSVYQQQLKDMIIGQVDKEGPGRDRPLEGLKIVVNAGNGMGGFLADTLADLGADTEGSVHLQPDGTFPNHLANPELPEAMAPTIEAVRSVGADLGIVLDTDVDRSGVVDRNGEPINRNRLIAFLATVVLRDSPGTTIVTDSTTSNGLKRFIESRGGKHLRFKKGYKNVIDKAIELNNQGTDCQLAIETSGHAAFKENKMLDDGAYLALKVLVEMARQGKGMDLSESIKNLAEPLESAEFRLRVSNSVEPSAMYAKTLEATEAAVGSVSNWETEETNFEGLRVKVDEGEGSEGWLMNRMSLHEPIVIFNVESEVQGGVAAIAATLLENVLEPLKGDLDLSSLETSAASTPRET
eukprot:g13175.t1